MSVFSVENLQQFDRSTIAVLARGTIEKGSFGEQLKLEIRPLDHEVGGEGTYKEWFPLSGSKDSKLGLLIKSLADLTDAGGNRFEMDTNTGDMSVGAEITGNAIGQVFRWVQKEVEFRGQKSKPTWFPTEALTQEQADAEIQANGGMRRKGQTSGASASSNGTVAPTVAATAQTAPDGLDDYILAQFPTNGLKRAELARLAVQDDVLKSPENSGIKQAVVNGTWVTRMIKAGKIKDDAGTYVPA